MITIFQARESNRIKIELYKKKILKTT